MRYLIGALCAAALLFGAAPSVAAAASVGCGRVTTFVGPNGAGSLPSGDGWVIFAKPSIDSVNATSLMWAAAILLLGPAVGLAARR